MKNLKFISISLMFVLALSSCNTKTTEESSTNEDNGVTVESSDGIKVDVEASPTQDSTKSDSSPSESTTKAPSVKSFSMTADKWKFTPSTITVNEGDTVRITLTSVDKEHGLAITEFGVNTKVKAGETKTIEFVASKKGTYKFFCSVFCGDGHSTMTGSLIVN